MKIPRRKFILDFIKGFSIIAIGAGLVSKRAVPRPIRRKSSFSKGARKFVRAIRLKKYPGTLRPLRNISKHIKWSG